LQTVHSIIASNPAFPGTDTNWKLSSTAMEPMGIVSCAISILDTGRAGFGLLLAILILVSMMP